MILLENIGKTVTDNKNSPERIMIMIVFMMTMLVHDRFVIIFIILIVLYIVYGDMDNCSNNIDSCICRCIADDAIENYQQDPLEFRGTNKK